MQSVTEIISSFSVQFGPWVVIAIFIGVCFLFSLITAILVYHWTKYGLGNKRIFAALVIYFVVSILILVLIFSAALVLIQR